MKTEREDLQSKFQEIEDRKANDGFADSLGWNGKQVFHDLVQSKGLKLSSEKKDDEVTVFVEVGEGEKISLVEHVESKYPDYLASLQGSADSPNGRSVNLPKGRKGGRSKERPADSKAVTDAIIGQYQTPSQRATANQD